MARQKNRPLSRPQVAPRIRLPTTREGKVDVLTVDTLQSSTQEALDQIARMTLDSGLDGENYKRLAVGTFANRPTPSEKDAGRVYLAFDTRRLYRDTGTAWVLLFSLTLSDLSGYLGVPFGSGTSFPGSPAVNDLFYRTDLDIIFSWDGTFWNGLGGDSNECSFSARKSGSQAITGGAGPAMTTITTYTSSHNFGSHMNMTTGVFTAPTAGLYEFSAWISLGGTIALNSRIRYWLNAIGGGETANGVANTRVGLIMTTGPHLMAASATMFAAVGTLAGVNPTVEADGSGIICGFSGRRIMARF